MKHVLVSILLMSVICCFGKVELDNGLVAIDFTMERENDEQIVKTNIYRYSDGCKISLPADDSAQNYYVFDISDVKFSQDRFYSYWLEKNKVSEEKDRIWSAFNLPGAVKLTPREAVKRSGRVIVTFDPVDCGRFYAIWQLEEGSEAFDVSLRFSAEDEGEYALGYNLFLKKDISEIENLLLPLMWQQKRFPEKPYTLFNNQTPTPVSMFSFTEEEDLYSYAIVAEPEDIDFEWPSQLNRHVGLSIRGTDGLVHPSICGPFDDDKESETVELNFKVIVQNKGWNKTFRYICDDIYKLSDYRENYNASLTDSIYNMIDLVIDDDKGGWWPRAKGFYQIESLNGATQSVPLFMLSLYLLTGDMDIYNRRTLPSVEYMLSRSAVHFSPEPQNTGHYNPGSMKGPVDYFGTTVYGGLWEMTDGLMPIFRDIAFEGGGINKTSGYSHSSEFSEWLEKYVLTGERTYLDKACKLADDYILNNIDNPAEKDIGIWPFFLIEFLPDWEGLLRMYEVTGNEKYLTAAKYCADILTTGIWTQPLIPNGDAEIHKGNKFEGDIPGICMRKGPTEFRLGYDQDPENLRHGVQIDPPDEKQVPAWLVSNVGLGFEQPGTLFHPLDDDRKARLVYQAAWTPNFLRLANYTGVDIYEKYARNAVLGRWSNYPGYYATGFTDMPTDENYPLVGPDISCLYYHHIPVHLAWSIDYLISDAALVSQGSVSFPSQRQNGYAYFDMRVYGNRPGKAFGEEGLWLWFNRNLVNVDNPDINYITAHRDGELFVIFINQSKKPQKFNLLLKKDTEKYQNISLFNDDAVEKLGSDTSFRIDARKAFMIALKLPELNYPGVHHTNKQPETLSAGKSFIKTVAAEGIAAKASIVQVTREFWSGYLWLEAKYGIIDNVVFNYSFDGSDYEKVSDSEYPFEFSTDTRNTGNSLHYFFEIETVKGKKYKTQPQYISKVE